MAHKSVYTLCLRKNATLTLFLYIFYIIFIYKYTDFTNFWYAEFIPEDIWHCFFIKLSITPENVTALLCVLTELFKKKCSGVFETSSWLWL